MSKLTSREFRLASRLEGIPAVTNFTLVRTELEPLQDGEVLVRHLLMSVDPYMRGRMNEGQSYVPPFELGKPLDGGALGEVVESRANEFRVGDAVTSSRGWREYFIAAAGDHFCCFRNILGRAEEEQRQARHGTVLIGVETRCT
jgi:NADPH-dependent curcumin reductase CurA